MIKYEVTNFTILYMIQQDKTNSKSKARWIARGEKITRKAEQVRRERICI